MGGRSGKSNWFDDKETKRPWLYRSMPACMVAPWKGENAEIRVVDMRHTSFEQFRGYLDKYTGTHKRFLAPALQHTADVRLSYNCQSDIMRFLLNYIGRDRRYAEEFRNCQV